MKIQEAVTQKAVQRFLSLFLFIFGSCIFVLLCQVLEGIIRDGTGLSGIICCLSCNAADVRPREAAALGTLLGSAAWGAAQNFVPITPSTVAGPGIVDTGKILYDIGTSKDPNRTAAESLTKLYAPGLDRTMRPLINDVLNFTKR
jgi:hypothetical protein